MIAVTEKRLIKPVLPVSNKKVKMPNQGCRRQRGSDSSLEKNGVKKDDALKSPDIQNSQKPSIPTVLIGDTFECLLIFRERVNREFWK